MNNGRYLIEGEQLAQLLNALTVTADLIEEVAFFSTEMRKSKLRVDLRLHAYFPL